MELLYKDESYKIRGAVFEVYKALGCVHKEVVYQRSLYQALLDKNFKVDKEKRLSVFFKNVNVGVYVPDLVVDDKIVIELKAKPIISQQDVKQFWQYLSSTNYKLGFLINFGQPGGVQIIRRVYDLTRKNTELNTET